VYVPERSPEALADALAKLAQDPERRRAMGEVGRRKIEELFDTEKNVTTLAALFQPAAQYSTTSTPPVLGAVAAHASR
jgi:glycosyltransferase involved in cell wall biosynthesis